MSGQKLNKLIIGIGNEGRGDDGLGWRFAEKMEAVFSDVFDVEYRYQLQVEDAELVSQYDFVVFADATVEIFDKGFEFSPCKLTGEYFFSSHTQSPEAVMYLSKRLYKKLPEAFIMRICGNEWEMGIGLSLQASKSLEKAIAYFEKYVINF
ncbi:MAG: hydrogenase maturation protease [Sphingobacteriales bacterium]|jgi:hydrogenase maturation protease|nr:hydrogenase maturation protease [Sphingobacteriales bacterium]